MFPVCRCHQFAVCRKKTKKQSVCLRIKPLHMATLSCTPQVYTSSKALQHTNTYFPTSGFVFYFGSLVLFFFPPACLPTQFTSLMCFFLTHSGGGVRTVIHPPIQPPIRPSIHVIIHPLVSPYVFTRDFETKHIFL